MNSKFLTNSKLSPEPTIDTDRSLKGSKTKVERVLRWFEKEGDDLVGERTINNVSLEHLQKLFGVDSENPMYDCYPLESSEQIDYLQNILNCELDLKSYDYLIECDAIKPAAYEI